MDSVQIKDVYFRRFMIPIVIAILVFAAIAVIIASIPGTSPNWETYSSVFGAQVAGALRRRK